MRPGVSKLRHRQRVGSRFDVYFNPLASRQGGAEPSVAQNPRMTEDIAPVEHNSMLGAARARVDRAWPKEAGLQVDRGASDYEKFVFGTYPGRMRRLVRFLLIIADCALVLEAFAVLKWRLVDWLYGPAAETSADRAIRERGPRA